MVTILCTPSCPDGYIVPYGWGPVKADGLTVDEFTAQLQQGLSRYIINPVKRRTKNDVTWVLFPKSR